MTVAPLRQVDYLDVLEQELLARLPLCPVHQVVLEGAKRACSLCARSSHLVEWQYGKPAEAAP